MDTSVTLSSGFLLPAQGFVPSHQAAASVLPQVTTTASTVSGSPTVTAIGGGQYGSLNARKDGLNELAQSVRESRANYDIRKLFPPYPPEREEEMAYIDELSGMRRQVEALLGPIAQLADDSVNVETDQEVTALSQASSRYFVSVERDQSISTNRSLLEAVAGMDTLQ